MSSRPVAPVTAPLFLSDVRDPEDLEDPREHLFRPLADLIRLVLVAAIPAVIAYNKLSSDFDRYAHRLEGFVGEFGAIVSRELERGDD